MALAGRERTIEEIWSELAQGLTTIFETKDRVPPKRYMELYTLVFNFCTRNRDDEQGHQLPNRRRNAAANNPRNANAAGNAGANGAEFVGGELYERLREFISGFARRLLDKFNGLHGEQLLDEYTRVWKDFQFSSTVVNGIFAYLNRHWIRREMDEGRDNVYEVYNLGVMLWKEVIFEQVHHNTTSAILKLITDDRNSEVIKTALIGGIVSSYIELGINEVEPEAGRPAQRANPKLAVYRDHFEAQFLANTHTYYTQESVDFVQHNSCIEYLKKVENRLREEQDRCQLYLDQSTQVPLAQTLNEVLIKQHLELFEAEFENLLENKQDEDLARMFMLCERVSGALDQLRKALETHVEKEGNDAILKIASTAVTDPKQYVTTLLQVYRRYHTLVVESFRMDAGFIQAMDKAFASFINKNHVTELAKSTSKSPELLARYCDLLLKKSSKNSEEAEMEELLNQVMTIFKYIEDKDVFQKYYSKMLAKRLVGDLSANDEAESSMIAKLKQMCGFEYTSKLQRMFTDSSVSKDLTEEYRAAKQGRDTGPDFSIMVLASAVWPFTQVNPFNVPPVLNDSMDKFLHFYQAKHNGRKLVWLLHQCRGELVGAAFSKKPSFITSVPQMATLMLYNDSLEYNINTLVALLSMGRDTLIPILQSFVKLELLKVAGNGSEAGELNPEAGGDTVLQLNLAFTSKKHKIDLTKAVMRSEVKKESDEVQKSVEDDRRIVIQAAIVRIMKMRKTLKHTALMTEVLGQLSNRFQPKVPVVKKCIDMLIEKEYVKRSEGDRDSYEYVA